MQRPDLATEEPEESRGPWRDRVQAELFGGLFEWWTGGLDKSQRSWIRVLREALIDFLLEGGMSAGAGRQILGNVVLRQHWAIP